MIWRVRMSESWRRSRPDTSGRIPRATRRVIPSASDAVQRRVGDLGESLGEIAGDAGFDVAQGVDGIAKPIAETSSVPLSSIGSHEVAEALLVQVVRAIALMVGQRGGFCVDVCGSGPIRFRTGLELDGFERREVVEVDLGGGQQRRVVGRGGELLVGVVGGVSAMFTMVVEDHPPRIPGRGEITESGCVDLACLGERAQELVGLSVRRDADPGGRGGHR